LRSVFKAGCGETASNRFASTLFMKIQVELGNRSHQGIVGPVAVSSGALGLDFDSDSLHTSSQHRHGWNLQLAVDRAA
jgi:hypothetical protein